MSLMSLFRIQGVMCPELLDGTRHCFHCKVKDEGRILFIIDMCASIIYIVLITVKLMITSEHLVCCMVTVSQLLRHCVQMYQVSMVTTLASARCVQVLLHPSFLLPSRFLIFYQLVSLSYLFQQFVSTVMITQLKIFFKNILTVQLILIL